MELLAADAARYRVCVRARARGCVLCCAGVGELSAQGSVSGWAAQAQRL